MEQTEIGKTNLRLTIFVCITLVVLVGVFAVIYFTFANDANDEIKNITVNILYNDVDNKQTQRTFKISTSGVYLRQAIDDAYPGMLDGDIHTVNGIEASGSQEWLLYRNGENLIVSADSVSISDGDIFDLALTSE